MSAESRTSRDDLPLRALPVRARTDRGILRQYLGAAERWGLADDTDQLLARLSRSGAPEQARCRRALLSRAMPRRRNCRFTRRSMRLARMPALSSICIRPTPSRCRCCRTSTLPTCSPPMTAYYVMRVGRTALVPYYRPGDPAVADAIRGLAGQYSAVLLANHGPVVAGKDLEAAVYATEELEETAKLRLLLHGLNPRLLTRAQVRDLVDALQAGRGDCRGHARGRAELLLPRPSPFPHMRMNSCPAFRPI